MLCGAHVGRLSARPATTSKRPEPLNAAGFWRTTWSAGSWTLGRTKFYLRNNTSQHSGGSEGRRHRDVGVANLVYRRNGWPLRATPSSCKFPMWFKLYCFPGLCHEGLISSTNAPIHQGIVRLSLVPIKSTCPHACARNPNSQFAPLCEYDFGHFEASLETDR